MTKNKENASRFYTAGRRKIDADRDALLSLVEEVRVRLEASAQEFIAKYQQEYDESAPQLEDSYKGTIRPYWDQLVILGIRDRIVEAGYSNRGAQITDPVDYKVPLLAQRAVSEGGILPDRLNWDSRLKQLNPEIKPCIIDAWSIVGSHNVFGDRKAHEASEIECYKGRSNAFVCLDKTGGLVIYQGPGGGRYDWEYYAHRFDPAEANLAPLPEHIHPKVINEFASQIRSGRCDEYVGALLVKAEERG